MSDEDEEESGQEEEDEEDAEEAPRKWQGIEAIFQAYHEYVDGKYVKSVYVYNYNLHLKVSLVCYVKIKLC